MSTFYNLPAVGERVSSLTQFIVREDAQLLYGFATAQERQAFRELIKISGGYRARRCPFCRAWASLIWPRPSPGRKPVARGEGARNRQRPPSACCSKGKLCRHRRLHPRRQRCAGGHPAGTVTGYNDSEAAAAPRYCPPMWG